MSKNKYTTVFSYASQANSATQPPANLNGYIAIGSSFWKAGVITPPTAPGVVGGSGKSQKTVAMIHLQGSPLVPTSYDTITDPQGNVWDVFAYEQKSKELEIMALGDFTGGA